MLYLTKKVMFSAAHRLYNPEFSEEKNDRVFDKCNNYYGHGHNYVLEVTIAGIPNPETGYVFDLKKLKNLLNEEIVSKLDHKHLNFDVDFLKGIIPTVENLTVIIWRILENKIPSGKLHSIKLYETENSYVEYFGEPIEIKKFD
jgi:6-pyruvoyltetrahydropterin/6-carboxytetrahydropterin synthase